MKNTLKQTTQYFLRLINIKHTLFGLPYVVSAMVLAAKGIPSFRIILLTLFCTVTLASGAMALNRWVDAKLDAKNPRTSHRILPSGKLTRNAALLFIIICFALFGMGAYGLNSLAFKLSPIPVALIIVNAYGKRFTSMTHYMFGLIMALAPIGAWIAVRGSFDTDILFYAVGVFTWYVGFDLFYALLDVDFFKKYRLYSIPSRFGNAVAILTARNMHLIAYLLFFIHGGVFSLGLFYFIGLVISGLILLYEHYMVSKYGIIKLDKRFFYMNSAISLILCAGTLMDIAVYGYRA